MLLLLLFGVFLEQRVRKAWLLATYTIGAVFGMWLNLSFLPQHSAFMGASAGVSTVMGAFAVFFWKFRIRCWVLIFPFYSKVHIMQTYIFVLAVYLLADMLGIFSMQSSNIAYLAHLGGWAVGASFAFVLAQKQALPWPYIQPQERVASESLAIRPPTQETLNFAKKLISWNRENYLAKIAYIKIAANLNSNEMKKSEFGKYLTETVAVLCRNGEFEKARKLLSEVPHSENLAAMIDRLRRETLVRLCQESLNSDDLLMVLQTLNALAKRNLNSSSLKQQLRQLEAYYVTQTISDEQESTIRSWIEANFLSPALMSFVLSLMTNYREEKLKNDLQQPETA
jgi:hypothetical protein